MAVVLPVSETATATELDSDVAVCASAKEVAYIMTKKVHPWTFGTSIFSTIKVKHCCRKHMCTARHDIRIWLSFQIRSDLAKSDH